MKTERGGSVFCTRTLQQTSRILFWYHKKTFQTFVYCQTTAEVVGTPSAHSFVSHQHFYGSGGVSLLSLAEGQVASSSRGWHMETNNLSHLRSHLCHQLSKLFSCAPAGEDPHADPDLVWESTHCVCCCTALNTRTLFTSVSYNFKLD